MYLHHEINSLDRPNANIKRHNAVIGDYRGDDRKRYILGLSCTIRKKTVYQKMFVLLLQPTRYTCIAYAGVNNYDNLAQELMLYQSD